MKNLCKSLKNLGLIFLGLFVFFVILSFQGELHIDQFEIEQPITEDRTEEKEFSSCIKILNKDDGPKPEETVCQAMPDLYLNKKTGNCLYRGCGYSPYTSPGPDWVRIQ